MPDVDQEGLRHIATQCVTLAKQFDKRLDWTLNSLDVIDELCLELLAEGPLNSHRLELWWKLIGAYTGEVLIQCYGGEWVTHEKADGALAVRSLDVFVFPFSTVSRILQGEPYKSIASVGRGLPAVSEKARRDAEK